MIENPSQPWIEDDFDFLKSDLHFYQPVSDLVSPVSPPSAHRVITGILRIGTAAIILSMVTGMMQAGAVVSLIGAAWLYYRFSAFGFSS